MPMLTKPTKFNKKSFLNKLEKYLRSTTDKAEVIKGKRGIAVKFQVHLPTIPDFAIFLGITKKTLYNWRNWEPGKGEENPKNQERKEVAEYAFDRILTEQQTRLINKGLSGDYNPTIAKLILDANHGIREEVNLNNKGEVTHNHNFNDQQIDRIAERIASRSRGNGDTSG
jgi:hypothetical protein